jgi:hemolysin activation/secretion protein
MRFLPPLIIVMTLLRAVPAPALRGDEAGASTFESGAELYRVRKWSDAEIAVPPVTVEKPPGEPPALQAPGPKFPITEFRVSGNTLLAPSRVDELLARFVGPDRTLADTQAARDALQKQYEDEGFLTVAVSIPPQTVASGVVRLEVIEARVGKVTVENEGIRWISDARVLDLVPHIRPGAVLLKKELEEDLRGANHNPDVQVHPVVRAGSEPGTVDVALQVDDQIQLHASTALNNYHTSGTPDWRSVNTASYSDLWGLGHQATASYQFSPFERFSDIQIVTGSYQAPMPWSADQSLFAYGLYSDSASSIVTAPGLGAVGKATNFGIRYQLGLPDIPGWSAFKHRLSLGVDRKDVKNILVSGQDKIETPIRYFPWTLDYSASAIGEQVYAIGQLGLIVHQTGLSGKGDRQNFQENRGGAKSGSVVTGDFQTLTFSLQSAVRMRALLGLLGAGRIIGVNRPPGDFSDDWTLNLLARTQWTSEPLIASEQFVAGGVASVRGYLEGERFGDRGWSTQLELRTPAYRGFLGEWLDGRLKERVQLAAFFDQSTLYTLSTTGGPYTTADLRSVGVGFRASFFDHVSTELFVADPIDTTENTDSVRIHFQVSAGF